MWTRITPNTVTFHAVKVVPLATVLLSEHEDIFHDITLFGK